DIAGPQPAITLDSRAGVPMQREWPLVGMIRERSIPIHANARKPRLEVELVPDVRPPAIDSGGERRLVARPIVLGMIFVTRRCAVADRPVQIKWWIDHVNDDVHAFVAQLLQHRGCIRKNPRIESEGVVTGVPSIRTKTGTEINH